MNVTATLQDEAQAVFSGFLARLQGSGASEGHHCHEILAGSGVEVVHFAKNKVGIHVVELEMLLTPSSSSSSKSSETQFR